MKLKIFIAVFLLMTVVSTTYADTSPTILSVTTDKPNGTYGKGDTIDFKIKYSEVVFVDTTNGTPVLELNIPYRYPAYTYASYLTGSGTDTLTFTYTIHTFSNSAELDYLYDNDLKRNGATIRNSNGEDANNTLPPVGTFPATHKIVIDGTVLKIVQTITSTIENKCDDCTSPIFVNFEINDSKFNDLKFHVPMNYLKTNINEIITLNITVFESRTNQIDVIQFGLVPNIGDPINDGEGLMEFHYGWDNIIDEIIVDDDMVKIVSNNTKLVHCDDEEGKRECLNLTVQYYYTERPTNQVINLNVFDVSHNPSNVFFNHGLKFPEIIQPIIKEFHLEREYRVPLVQLEEQERIAADFMKSYYR